ncbi:2'-5' RNA ligase family protein [Actinokineospora cianjurensis]|uniref:2'-5' RNA ligase n=1 Tax=Actinokineospora cianjurensis TaxID=585224 RepID=A0A421B626_9PSEU|nr:2'-5' RNA ligase family protein [Actinokineospora cianjurensis]RLK59814.1 2'-5' RNA ligase [Actinokineospora cianjurensis]
MAQGVVVLFDERANAALARLLDRLDTAGVPGARRFPPHVTFAMASDIPARTRAALKADLRVLSIPNLWLYTLSAFSHTENVLMLGAVVDTELLAVHSAVHDVLAGKVKNPNSYYLPGSWVPHCTLAHGMADEQTAVAFRALFPVEPVEARVARVAILDTATGDLDVLV